MSTAGAGRRFTELDPGLPPARKELATALREARERTGLSLRDVAHRTAISPGTLSKIFSGLRLPSSEQMRDLYHGLRMDGRPKDELALLHARAEDESLLLSSHGPKPEPIGAELRRHRVIAGMSLAQLSGLSHYSKSYISKIENGLRLPTPTAVENLANALRLSAEETSRLLGLLPKPHTASTTEPHAPGMHGAVAAGGLLTNLLVGLKSESGLSVREIAQRIKASGITASKSSIDRALVNPVESPQMSLHVAAVMIEELPTSRRGPIREALFQNLLALQGAASQEDLEATFWKEDQDLLVKKALAFEIEPGDDLVSDDDVEELALQHAYEDEQLNAVLVALTPEQRQVVDAYGSAEGITWTEAAERAGVTNPEVMGELVRRKIKRLAAETRQRQARVASELVATYRAKLLQEVDLAETSSLPPAERRARLERVLGRLLSRESPALSTVERSWLIRTAVDEVLGLPLG